MKPLQGKNILLGITGGIAAYKSAELVRRLSDAGASVRVIMTEAATRFVTPLTFEALTGHPVHTEMFAPRVLSSTVHIELARWPDLMLVAPASANTLAKVAYGLADDLMSTTCLALLDRPLAVAPAMNLAMWGNPATQANCRILSERGVLIWGPADGYQACGETGSGRMLEARELADRTMALLKPSTGLLAGKKVLMTAGPTREAIDPVRYITNRSSGRMGCALAQACLREGADVIVVSGPMSATVPPGAREIRVETALQMRAAVMEHVATADVFIATAAVADYRVDQVAAQKIKKTQDAVSLQLVQNPDILAEVAQRKPAPFTVGFAAETENVRAHAEAKLVKKGLDMIVANRVGDGRGFESEMNEVDVFFPGGEQHIPCNSKEQIAEQIVELLGDRLNATN